MRRTAITNVRVFDGAGLTEPRTVVIDNKTIRADTTGARPIDGAGGTLLPGLIDAHVHLHGRENLEQLTRHGVTTGLDMATTSAELLGSLRNRPGLTDIRSAGIPAIAPPARTPRCPACPPTPS